MSYSSRASTSFLPIVLTGSAVAVGLCSVCIAFLINSGPTVTDAAHGPRSMGGSTAPPTNSAAAASSSEVDDDSNSSNKAYPDEIRNEIFSRVRTFFGEEEYANLQQRFVVVVGLGGVGSHAAHMLVRSGVSRMRLIDFDQVTLSSLNRHAVASMEDVGLSKAEAMRRKLLKIVPWCQIEAVTEMFRQEAADALLAGAPDFVLDCIDDVSTKAELIAYCVKRGITVLTSMGAGGKADPTRLRISALSDCTHDPLATKIKWKLKKHDVLPEQVMSVFSVEQPMVELLPLEEEQKNAPQDFGVVDYLRLRVIPVLGTSPSIFGQAMASYVLCSLAGKLYVPEGCERLSKNVKHKMRQVLESSEMRRFHTARDDLDLDDDDIEFIVQQVWHTRCAATGRKIGGHAPMVLTRWDAAKAPTPYNLVLMQRTLAQQLEEGGQGSFAPEVVETINRRLAWAERVCAGAWTPQSQLQSVSAAGGGSGGGDGGDDRCKGSDTAAASVAQVLTRCVERWHALTRHETTTVLLLTAASATGSACCYLAGRYAGATAAR